MKTALFDFELPESLIATHPVTPRDSARMLVVQPEVPLKDKHILDLPEYLKPGDVVVLNNTRVIPARLKGKRGEASIEILLHKALQDKRWRVFAKPAKRLKRGDTIVFAPDFTATVQEKYETGEAGLLFSCNNFYESLEKYGTMPLPPYIRRVASAEDNDHYQTMYAQEKGAVAAPTAGLHFTPALMQALEGKGIQIVYVTLHVGAGTFQPVKAEDISGHVMHSEYAYITPEAAAVITTAKQAGRKIVAIGTTSLRVLETAATQDGTIKAFSGETDIFITPGYRFRLVDILLTNFHLPRSTLFMLVSAFCGLDAMKSAYQHAIDRQYRFYSYGDACLLFSDRGK